MKSKFSIIIPYHAEVPTMHFAKRQLNYYHCNPTSMVVILAVSGEEALKIELEEFIGELNDPRFLMFTTDETDITNAVSFVKKISAALKLVTTPYVTLNGVDDVVIPEAAYKGVEILDHNADIAGVKGYTVVYYWESGSFLSFQDLEIMSSCPFKRLSLALKDLDSIFYIARRTKDLIREFDNIVSLSERSKIVGNSFYHIEHFMALSLVSLGKVYVLQSPWRLQGSHENNHASYTPASFFRVQLGVLDRANYEWFKLVNKNMHHLSYNYYRLLWVCSQIRGISITVKQIAYRFIYKDCSLKDAVRVFIYFILHKVFILIKKIFPDKRSMFLKNQDFFKTEQFRLLKKYYFSEEDIKLIESNET